MGWTRPSELKAQVMRLWERGELLRSLISDEPVFPKRLKFTCPTSSEISEQYDAVRKWVTEVKDVPHCRIVMREYKHRVFGKNELPAEAWVDTADQAFALIGMRKEASRFREILNLTNHRQPALISWLHKRPLQALDLFEDWERLLSTVEWMQANNRPGIYLRQVDLKDIHTKFIESHLSTLSELLDLVLPPEAIENEATGVNQFARKYGFLSKPSFVRFRILDPHHQLFPIAGNQDISLDSSSFAQLSPPVSRVFFTENEVNYLAFPPVAKSMVIFGSGYGFERLEKARWLHERSIYYWGDIDTHGFAILASARKYFSQTRSLLMNEETLLRHRSFWGKEPSQFGAEKLPQLTADEQLLYSNLKWNTWQENIRLEQERVSWAFAIEAIHKIVSEG
ncbi:MAG: hypothetical protein IT342_21315 [Candidatus Melainabacteria bacterium]|nr:hypothetical protein [Candidatus Melainabacteria bacterium]